MLQPEREISKRTGHIVQKRLLVLIGWMLLVHHLFFSLSLFPLFEAWGCAPDILLRATGMCGELCLKNSALKRQEACVSVHEYIASFKLEAFIFLMSFLLCFKRIDIQKVVLHLCKLIYQRKP